MSSPVDVALQWSRGRGVDVDGGMIKGAAPLTVTPRPQAQSVSKDGPIVAGSISATSAAQNQAQRPPKRLRLIPTRLKW